MPSEFNHPSFQAESQRRDPHPRALAVTWRVLKAAVGLNLAWVLFIVSMGTALLVAPDATLTAVGASPTADRSALLLGMRVMVPLGLAGAYLTHRILTRVIAMVQTVRDGDPFVAPNARRLEEIAWAALGIQLLHLAVGIVSAAASIAEQPLDVDWTFALTPWVAVLLLFVLARVFAHGTGMRDELEGVV